MHFATLVQLLAVTAFITSPAIGQETHEIGVISRRGVVSSVTPTLLGIKLTVGQHGFTNMPRALNGDLSSLEQRRGKGGLDIAASENAANNNANTDNKAGATNQGCRNASSGANLCAGK